MNRRMTVEHGDRDWRHAHVCGNKSRLSERDAWSTAKRLRKEGDDNLHAYHCPDCGFFHIGYDKKGQRHRAEHEQITTRQWRNERKDTMNGRDYPEQFDGDDDQAFADAEYEAWRADREKELLADIDSGVHLKCMLAAFDALDRAMAKPEPIEEVQ